MAKRAVRDPQLKLTLPEIGSGLAKRLQAHVAHCWRMNSGLLPAYLSAYPGSRAEIQVSLMRTVRSNAYHEAASAGFSTRDGVIADFLRYCREALPFVELQTTPKGATNNGTVNQ